MNEPRPLIEKGKYDAEPKLHWVKKKSSPVKTPRLNLKPEDAVTWYESTGEAGKKQEKEQQEPSTHVCISGLGKSKINRCQVCGLILDKNYRNFSEITPLNFLYPDPVLNNNEPRGVHMQTIVRPTNSNDMKDFLMYVMGTNKKSINEVYRKHKNIPPNLHKYLTHRIEKQIGGDDLLRFDSNFESGNLARVYCVSEVEYDLYLNVDTNTKGHTQWFYFSVACTEAPGKVTFHIKNCCKWESVYGDGMKISIFSVKDNEVKKVGWVLGGENITYNRNTMKRDGYILNNTTTGGNNAEDSDQELDEELGRESFKPPPLGEVITDYPSIDVSGANTQRTETNSLDSPTFKNKLTIKTNAVAQPNNLVTTGNTSTKNQTKNNNNSSINNNNNDPQQQIKKKKFYYYTLSFTYNFTNNNDLVYFAYMKPYTFTDLVKFFIEIESELQGESHATSTSEFRSRASSYQDHSSSKNGFRTVEINTPFLYYKREKIGNTISGIPLYMLTITGKDTSKRMKRRKGVFLTARVHPGEVNSSFVMQGIIKYLVGKTEPAKSLRDLYVFKIVPMLNPEGVAAGNNRTNPAGSDLNRKWNEPNEKLHPCIYYCKQALEEFRQEREILVFCDIHGHSTKKNAFIYGCNTAADGGFCSWTKVRLFPRIFARRSHYFSFNDCCFRVTPDRAGTARVTVWREFKVTNSFTLEVSLWGYDYGDKVVQFTDTSLEELGTQFLLSLLEYTYVWASLTQELVLTGGWLKPSKLVEVSGTPAQQILSIKLKEEKEEKRRKERQEKIEAKKAEIANRNRRKKRTVLNSTMSNATQLETSRDFSSEPSSLVKGFQQHFSNLLNGTNHNHNESPDNSRLFIPESRDNSKIRQREPLETEANPVITSLTDDSELLSPIKTINYNDHEIRLLRELDGKDYHLDSLDKDELSFVECVKRNRGSLAEVVQDIKEDWREYFTDNELNQNYNMILNGKDPNDLEVNSAESDSEGSGYSLDKEEYDQVVLRDPRAFQKRQYRMKPNSYVRNSNSKPHPKPRDDPKPRDSLVSVSKLNTSMDMKKNTSNNKQLPTIVGINVKRLTPLPLRKSQNESLKLSLHTALSMCVEKKDELEVKPFKEENLDKIKDLKKRRLALRPLESQRKSIERERIPGGLEELIARHPLPDKFGLEINGDSIEYSHRGKRNEDRSQDSLDPDHLQLDAFHSSLPKIGEQVLEKYYLDDKFRIVPKEELFRRKRAEKRGKRIINESLEQAGICKLTGNNVSVIVNHKDKRSIEIYASYKKSRDNSSKDPQFDDNRYNSKPMQRLLEEPTFGGKIFSRLAKHIFFKTNNRKNAINNSYLI